jgi:molybdate transport system regulatory protein
LPTAEIKITFARVSQPPITDAGDRIMKRKTSPARLPALHPRFRIVCRKEIAFGPGKADLLELIAETGSIGKAASRMKMSYMRAWTLVQTMNQCFNKPLILATHGGEGGGGAELTESGRQILALYRRLETKSAKATQATWNKMQSLLRSGINAGSAGSKK